MAAYIDSQYAVLHTNWPAVFFLPCFYRSRFLLDRYCNDKEPGTGETKNREPEMAGIMFAFKLFFAGSL